MPDSCLDDDLAGLDPALLAQLQSQGFDAERLRGWEHDLLRAGPEVNRVAGVVAPPAAGDVVDLPERGSDEGRRLERLGLGALGEGRLAMVVLAGGMATRMGSVVKGLVEAIPGATFLDARLAEREYWQRTSGAQLPMWLMTSHATDGPIREALGGQIDGERVDAFEQGASLRLTPDGCLFRGDDGLPSIHATGHGDLPEALAAAGLLDRFLAAGGRYLWIMNLDNLGAAVDPLVLGWHIDHGAQLTVEVVDKQEGDRGGIPVRLDGRPVVLENFRLPDGFDEDTVRVFNTNTFVADARRAARPADGLVVVPGRKDGRRPPGDPVRAPGGRAHLRAREPLPARAAAGGGFAVPAGQELGRAGRPPRADRRPHRADAGTGSRRLVTHAVAGAAVALPVHALLDLLVPPRCAVCRLAGPLLCAACLSELPLLDGSTCARCGPPAERPVDDCASCRGRRWGSSRRPRRCCSTVPPATWCMPSRTAACAVSPRPPPR